MEIETIDRIAHDSVRRLPPQDALQTLPQLPIAYALELHRMIEMEAFLMAEKDGFVRPPEDYWLQAECMLHRYF